MCVSALAMVVLVNIFSRQFLGMFNQDDAFVTKAVPVPRVILLGMLAMSISTVWLNAVTGTGRTKMNFLIEIIAIITYSIYIYFIMIKWKLPLSTAWTNELVYWSNIFHLISIH